MRRGIRGRTRSHGKNSHEESQDRAETKNHASTIKKFQFSANGILQEREDLLYLDHRGNSSVGRASASQAERRGFESLFPLKEASARMLFCLLRKGTETEKRVRPTELMHGQRECEKRRRDLTAKLAGPKGERARRKAETASESVPFPAEKKHPKGCFSVCCGKGPKPKRGFDRRSLCTGNASAKSDGGT